MPEKHDANFYYQEDKAAANIGRDDAPAEDPRKRQEFLQQRQADWDFEDEQERIENQTERLYQLLQQEGVIGKEGAEEYYPAIHNYVAYGEEPGEDSAEQEKDFFEKMAAIDERDRAGEWGGFTHGQTNEKAKKE